MKVFFKKYFVAGIVVLVPVVVTIWVLKVLIVWMDGLIFSLLPHQLRPQYLLGFDIPGAGLFVTIAIILLTGVLTRLYIGKKVINLGDRIFARLPFGRAIYQATKQVINSTIVQEGKTGRRVVFVEFPKVGSHAIGFVTGRWADPEQKGGEKSKLMVFVPTAPNPTSGFLLVVDESNVIDAGMSTEEASKLLISGGLLSKS